MPDGEQAGIAGARLADGRLAWVEGAPPELEIGAIVRFRAIDGEHAGTVEIPPRLLAWRDPEVRCARFVSAAPPMAPPPPEIEEPAAARFRWHDVPSDGPGTDEMLRLARQEIGFLGR